MALMPCQLFFYQPVIVAAGKPASGKGCDHDENINVPVPIHFRSFIIEI
jgi:hypothetical protein